MPDPEKPRRPQRKPSDWSPRPIPQPAPERRTADPVTPTLKELAARERERASLAAVTWIGVRLITPDGLALVDNGYEVTASDGCEHASSTNNYGRGRVTDLAPGECTVMVIASGQPYAAPGVHDDVTRTPTSRGTDGTRAEDSVLYLAAGEAQSDVGEIGPQKPAGYWVEDFSELEGSEDA